MTISDKLLADILRHYQPSHFPALHAQMTAWRQSRPLAGKSVLDATPVFRNTLCKYLALLAGGAQLSVYAHPDIPCDQEVRDSLHNYGIRLATASDLTQRYDVVCDCAGALAQVPNNYGVVELTRSGVYHYQYAPYPVFFVDAGKIKVIETGLGTGDGFFRAMAALGYGDLRGKNIVIFGCGKVGRGIALYALNADDKVIVVDDFQRAQPLPGTKAIDMHDRAAIDHAMANAFCAVSTTGVKHALANSFDQREVCASATLLVNMGVVDEYGPGIPAERVLNRKAPINFILPEPTQLKYIDPTMALDNAGVIELLQHRLQPGINIPSSQLEDKILAVVRKHGVINDDLALLDNAIPQSAC